jgi:arylsulfatase A-like enzyme
MVKSMDDAVGTLMDAVEKAGLTEKTIFIFTSDNGGNMYNGIPETIAEGSKFITEPTSNHPLRGGKATMFEGGIRVPTAIVWPGLTTPTPPATS